MSNVVFGIICGILEFIVFVFVAISVGTDILRSKTKGSWDGENRQCFSFWGTKRCGPHKHNPKLADGSKRLNKGFPTSKILHTVDAAVAFDIVGLASTLICFITCLTMACYCHGGCLPMVFALLSVVFLIITIGCLLGVWYTKIDVDLVPGVVIRERVKKFYNLGYGTILIIACWCLQVIVFVLLIIAACCCSSGKPDKKEEKGDDSSSKNKSGDTSHEPNADNSDDHSPK